MATRSPRPTDFLRRRIAGEVVAFFNDKSRDQKPVQRAVDPFMPRGSVAWRVHGDVTSMMVGGIAALLLQMLHPKALAGVWDHSDFRADMHGRLRNTARFIAVTTFGDRADAEAAIAKVKRIHDFVSGTLPDGDPYDANDPWLLAFVHVAGSAMFLEGWRRFGEPGMSITDQDQYWLDVAPMALALGADPVPVTVAEAAALMARFRPELVANARSRDVAHTILHQPAAKLRAVPVQAMLMQSGVDLLPGWARTMHGLRGSGLARPALGAVTAGLAKTLRWALTG